MGKVIGGTEVEINGEHWYVDHIWTGITGEKHATLYRSDGEEDCMYLPVLSVEKLVAAIRTADPGAPVGE